MQEKKLVKLRLTRKEFDEKLKALGLIRQDFCNLTGFAYSSVSNRNDKNKTLPTWLNNWLKYYEKAKVLEKTLKVYLQFGFKD